MSFIPTSDQFYLSTRTRNTIRGKRVPLDTVDADTEEAKEHNRKVRNHQRLLLAAKKYKAKMEAQNVWNHWDPQEHRLALRHVYHPVTHQWDSELCFVQFDKQSFDKGSLRECFKMKEVSRTAKGRIRCQNAVAKEFAKTHRTCYVAKRYIDPAHRGLHAKDAAMQMSAASLGNQWNEHRLLRKAAPDKHGEHPGRSLARPVEFIMAHLITLLADAQETKGQDIEVADAPSITDTTRPKGNLTVTRATTGVTVSAPRSAAATAKRRLTGARVTVTQAVQMAKTHQTVDEEMIETIAATGVENFCVEAFEYGKFTKHNNNSGFVTTCRKTPQAFSHFCWEKTNPKMMVVDIQGIDDLYTDPAIHAPSQFMWCEANLGLRGVALYFHSHECNEVCHFMELEEFPVFRRMEREPTEVVSPEDVSKVLSVDPKSWNKIVVSSSKEVLTNDHMDAAVHMEMATMFISGRFGDKDGLGAIMHLGLAARAGLPCAVLALARVFALRQCEDVPIPSISEDPDGNFQSLSLILLEKAAAAGHLAGVAGAATALHSGVLGRVDLLKAVHLYAEYCDILSHGDIPEKLGDGLEHPTGWGCDFGWCNSLVTGQLLTDIDAAENCAKLYAEGGAGLTVDRSKAAEWYEAAAELATEQCEAKRAMRLMEAAAEFEEEEEEEEEEEHELETPSAHSDASGGPDRIFTNESEKETQGEVTVPMKLNLPLGLVCQVQRVARTLGVECDEEDVEGSLQAALPALLVAYETLHSATFSSGSARAITTVGLSQEQSEGNATADIKAPSLQTAPSDPVEVVEENAVADWSCLLEGFD